jgi:hypothetical protein
MRKPILTLAVPAILALLSSAPARAQVATRPHLEWRTVRTAHFTVHYPAEAEAWTLDLVPRLEAVHDEVAAAVGFTPTGRVTVVIEDPSGQANGSAFPFLDEPVISLWPTPADPRSSIGSTRDPAEQLAVHELTHIAHLARPSRNPRRRRITRLAPVRLGPVALRAPRWLAEGYATYVEGRLTGSGRPHSAIRAAVLRQWALEGKLPRYEQLSSSAGFQGGAMAYLAGSAFLEWLVEQRGEQSLPDLWRRMSARRERSFDAAFAGVFGAGPAELYGRFTVDVTERALAARAALQAAGLAGDTVQRLNWGTGDPAVSPDGRQVAVVLRGATAAASRVVVWRADDERVDTAVAARARRALLAADPEDVPDIPARRPAKRALATLYPVNGRAHDQPRFMPDGRGILVTRSEPLADGALRPDLFLWEWRSGSLRRVTRGAGVRWPDPAPDGRSAVAVQCRGGLCGLATVDLATGAVHTLAAARPNLVFYRPRWSPDGASIAVSVQEGGRWQIALVDPATGALRRVGPDDGASRYDAAFLPGGRSLVVASERGGVANLEVIDLATGEVRALTRVTGAAAAPEPDRRGGVFYLSLHARGMDVMRIRLDSAARSPVVVLDAALAPAAPPALAAVEPDTLRRAPLPSSRAYGLGPRRTRLLPAATTDANGTAAGVVVMNGDPVGRLTAMLRVVAGNPQMPRGAGLGLVYRRWLPAVGLDAFLLEHRPSHGGGALVLPADSLDARYTGAALYVEQPWSGSAFRHRLRVGASAGALKPGDADAAARSLAFVEAAASLARSRGIRSLAATLRLNGSAGRTEGEGWTRGVGTLAVGVGFAGLNGRGEVTYGAVTAGAPEWERFVVGGSRQPLFDDAILPQRLPLPAARFGVVRGRELLAYRLSTQLSGVTPYLAGAVGGGAHGDGYHVAGVEMAFDSPPMNLLGIPGVRLVAGAGYPLDAPDRHKVRLYGTVTYRP